MNGIRTSAAAVAACLAGYLAAPAAAAPATYEASVLGNNPYVYYRSNDSTGPTAEDATANNRDGTYVNSPTLGVPGYGTPSDAAVSYVSSSYLSAPISTFGSSVPSSSYEFLFKADTANFTQAATLFGLINADPDGAGVGRTGNQAVAVEVNASGVNGGTTADTSRIWLRDEDGSQLWANIPQGTLLDGSYHHFVVTVDLTAATAIDKVKAYIDGLPVSISAAAESAALADNWQSFTVNGALAARNVRDTSVDRFAPITVDEMALYTSTLTPDQVAAHATAAGFVVPEPGSLAVLGMAGLGLLARRGRRA